jgi:hypothetical protein
MADAADRRAATDPVEYIDCDVPRDMTLREWRRGERAPSRAERIRAAAAAVERAARRRRRAP